MTLFKNFIKDESGATAVEYGVLVAVVGIFIIGGATVMGGAIDQLFRNISSTLTGNAAPTVSS